MNSSCVFEFKTTPTYGWEGMYGGYSITVYENGDIVRREFIFGVSDSSPSEEIVLASKPNLTKIIQSIIKKHSIELSSIPSTLSCRVCDGSHERFIFGDKTIHAWTICRHDIEEIKKHDPIAYMMYGEEMIFENQILDIYDEIKEALKKDHIEVSHTNESNGTEDEMIPIPDFLVPI